MTPPETSSSTFVKTGRHAAAGSRRYRSKAQRPCDLCRARKALCNIPDPTRPCQLCDRTGRPCTFLAGTRSRPMRSSPSSHSADGADSLAGQEHYTASVSQRTHSLMDSTPSLEQSIGGMIPTQWSLDLEQLGQTETFMQDIPSFWSLSYDDASVADVAEGIVEPDIRNEVSSRPQTQTTLNRHDRSTSFIGYSNESDPFLLEHYPYSASDELDFFMVTYRRPSLLQGVSVGHPPIHFLQSKPQAALQNQEAMGACLALKNERDVLNDLVSVEMGVALLRL